MDPSKETEFKSKISRLVKRLLERKVVPFIGAGVSNTAKHENGENGFAQINKLLYRIAADIYRMGRNGNENQKRWSRWCCKHTDRSLKKTSLDKLCEMHVWVKGTDSEDYLVRNVLRIEEFVKLLPTHAHRYIAFLAREGLIDEAITTNYDTCLERAYRQTYNIPDVELDARKDPALVITNLESFRKNAGAVTTGDGEDQKRCLKIYKINGCAKRLRDGKDGPETILLTECQLQEWRQRHWARDLFRDRLRSRTLLFTGFGSEEPQVRHTALQVVEEFYSDSKKPSIVDVEASEWWELPNAPYVAAFENHLSFSQTQILHAYVKAHSTDLVIERLHQNTFTGLDSLFFKNEGNKLPADIFWKRVFQVSFWQLLKDYCRQGSAVLAFLSGITPSAEVLLREMLDWLIPENELYGRFDKLLDVECCKGTIPLSLWAWCVRYKDSCEQQSGIYIPLIERPVLIPLLLLIIYLIAGIKDREQTWQLLNQRISINKGYFTVKMAHCLNETRIFVAHYEKAFQDQEIVNLPDNFYQPSFVQILISNNNMSSARRKRIKVNVSNDKVIDETKQLRMVSVYQVPFRDLFYNGNEVPRSVHSAKKVFQESLLQPILITANARPRLRERAKLL